MCNAWQHSWDCTCGFGGSGSGGLRIYNLNTINNFIHDSRVVGKAKFTYRERYGSLKIEDAKTYPRKCWWCNTSVFHHTNGYGDTVLFDSLGKPWLVHSCWSQYWEIEKERRKKYELSYPRRKFEAPLEKPIVLRNQEEVNFNQLKKLIFQGAIQSLESTGCTVSELRLAAQLGISVELLRLEYGYFYQTS
jgi:hypothetical protein